MAAISRPALRYYGGKFRAAPWILSHFPAHVCYVEPFGGAASVLLRKEPSYLEVYNDRFSDVTSFFRVLRERPDELIRAIELTPYSRAEYMLAQQPADDDLERARRLYIRSWQGRGRAGTIEPGGWRFMASDARGSRTVVDDWTNTGHLWAIAARLRQVQIECDDALAVIRRYDTPSTLFYCDPPYLPETRGERWANCAYAHEMGEREHRALANALDSIRGMAIVSGYPSALYDELYRGWQVVRRPALTDNGTREAVECLWLSPAVVQRRGQLSLGLPV